MISKSVLRLVFLACLAAPALAQAPKPKPAAPGFMPFGDTSSKEPIAIEADRLEVFDKEQRAVYTGNVIVRQGDTTMKSAHMVVFYDRGQDKAAPAGTSAEAKAGDTNGPAALRRVEARGGVSVTSKTQVATGNEGVYEKAQNRIVLTGNVALSDGPNVTKGEKLTYDLASGVAVVERGPTTRVQGLFVPANPDKKDEPAAPDKKAGPAAPAKKDKSAQRN